MTTAKAANLPTLTATSALLPALRPDALPGALVATRKVDGFRQPQWVTRDLQPGEAVDLQQALVALDMRLTRAPEGKTLELVARLLNNWKNDRTEDEKDWLFEDFAEDLEEFSAEHLAAACREWRRNNSYPPKIADMRALCIDQRALDLLYHRRCRVLLGLERPLAQEVLPARDAAQLIELKPAQKQFLNMAVVGKVVSARKA